MNSTTHLVIGAAVGVAVVNPEVALIAGIASHIVLDTIPHTDQGSFMPEDNLYHWPAWVIWSAIFDFAVGIALILLFLYVSKTDLWLPMILGAFGGVLIDLVDNTPYWRKSFHKTIIGKSFHKFHNTWHNNFSKQNWYWGIATQLLALGGGICFLLKKL